jgi:hypothetical protein
LSEIVRGQAAADRKSEEVDDLVRIRPDQVGAENALAAVFDQDLEAVNRLGDAARRVPVRHLLTIDPEFEPGRARLRFAQAHGGDRRQREGDAAIAVSLAVAFFAYIGLEVN